LSLPRSIFQKVPQSWKKLYDLLAAAVGIKQFLRQRHVDCTELK